MDGGVEDTGLALYRWMLSVFGDGPTGLLFEMFSNKMLKT